MNCKGSNQQRKGNENMKSIKSKANTRKQDLGFSVVELMIALSVASILVTTAVPSYSAVVHKNRISAATTQLYVSLNTARSAAMKRRSAVRVCPSADGSSCRNDGDWSDGWLIFEDVNANNAADTAEIIQLVDDFDGEISIQVATAVSDFVQFQPTGAAIGSGGNSGEFRLCHLNSNAFSRVINVSASGRVNSVNRTQTDCNAS
jgi:type IV fimbrial biogenesis protein FimT